MSDRESVTCGAHGTTPCAFACCHVTRGVSCGFYASNQNANDQWPDAWCDLCEEAYRAAGAWNDESEAVADVKVMCTHCYEAARARNLDPPRHARGARSKLTPAEASALFEHANDQMQAAQAASEKRWGWKTMAKWHFDDVASTLTFSDPARPSIIANVRLVGSYSTRSNTFQWAWQTFEDGAPPAHDISRLRIFGDVRGLAKLTTGNWKCEEVDGWGMASLAGYLLGTEAIYRAPVEHARWFMLLSNLRHMN